MKNLRFARLAIIVLLMPAACKNASTSSSSVTSGNDVTGLAAKITRADVMEFYELVKDHYLYRVRDFQFVDDDRFETRFFQKFGLNLKDNSGITAFSKNLFEFMESTNFAIVLHGIPKKQSAVALPPKGLTNRDLEDFLQVVKTEYFKYIAGVQIHNFGAQELRFYARMQGLPPSAMPRQGDLLIIAGDLFNRIETGK